MSEAEESLSTRGGTSQSSPSVAPARSAPLAVSFNRRELDQILRVYGRMVSEGEWRDYAMDFHKEKAIFSIFRRTSEMPIYRVEKEPKNARKQGAYAVVAAGGMILKRGHELDKVLRVFEKKRHLRVV